MQVDFEKINDEIRTTKNQLRNLEHALSSLTHDATEGNRWQISSQALEFFAKANRAIIELHELMDDAKKHWK